MSKYACITWVASGSKTGSGSRTLTIQSWIWIRNKSFRIRITAIKTKLKRFWRIFTILSIFDNWIWIREAKRMRIRKTYILIVEFPKKVISLLTPHIFTFSQNIFLLILIPHLRSRCVEIFEYFICCSSVDTTALVAHSGNMINLSCYIIRRILFLSSVRQQFKDQSQCFHGDIFQLKNYGNCE